MIENKPINNEIIYPNVGHFEKKEWDKNDSIKEKCILFSFGWNIHHVQNKLFKIIVIENDCLTDYYFNHFNEIIDLFQSKGFDWISASS